MTALTRGRYSVAKITAVNNDDDLAAAVARVDELFKANPDILNAGPDHPEYQELNAIADLVFAYEDIHCPMGEPTPAGRIQGSIDALGLAEDALIPALGSRERVDAVLAGQQEVTPAMAAALYELLAIDVRDLLPQAAGVAGS